MRDFFEIMVDTFIGFWTEFVPFVIGAVLAFAVFILVLVGLVRGIAYLFT